MRIRVLSDIHLEHYTPNGRRHLLDFLTVHRPKMSADVCVLAGDICNIESVAECLSAFAFRHKHVIVVLGNHDHFGYTRDEANLFYKREADRINQSTYDAEGYPLSGTIHVLDAESVVIDGVKFSGATLWYEDVNPHWIDFGMVTGLATAIKGGLNAKHRQFLLEAKPDIVVTHMLPAYSTVNGPWVGMSSNNMFVGADEAFIESVGARLWLHGHSHVSYDKMHGKTRVVRNPHGYDREFRFLEPFDIDKIIDIEPVERTREKTDEKLDSTIVNGGTHDND